MDTFRSLKLCCEVVLPFSLQFYGDTEFKTVISQVV
jgi:hypothetical protein